MGFEELVAQMTATRDGLLAEADQRIAEANRLGAAIAALTEGAAQTAIKADAVQLVVDERIVKAVGAEGTKPGRTATSGKADEARERWAEIVAWACKAIAAGTYSMAAITAEFGGDAKNWRARAAKYGIALDIAAIPKASSAKVLACTEDGIALDIAAIPKASSAKVLACTEDGCEATFEITQAARLNTHTIGEHGRRASEDERRPVLA